MRFILALAAAATATTDVFLASDRMAASAAVLNSVCDNSQPTALRLHLLAPTKEAAQTLATATETACDGAVVLPYGLAEFETLVRTRVGEEPMWTTALSKVERSKSTYAVPVVPWDRDEKHTSPYNHARFYAPQLIEGDTLVMLDDDVIVQGDVTTLTTQNKAVAAGCQQWYVGHEGEFRSSTTLSYADVPYFGFGVLSAQDDPGCSHEGATECIPGDARHWFAEVARTDQAVARRASWPRLLRRLAAIGDDAFPADPSPDAGDAFVDELYNTRAWNFGLVVIDLDAWKQHQLTAKYTGWLEANARMEFWPSDSLAFGLGLPFLALRGEVECFEDNDDVRFEQGLGVAPWVHTDRDTKTLDEAFALHWNGNRKPWDMDRCDEETRPYFLRYLARSPGLYGGHVAESGGDYWAACAPPPPRYHGFRFQRKLYGVNSVEGTAWATYADAYVWAEDFYRYDLDRSASNISDCVAICRDLFPDVVGGGTLACPRTKLELELLRDRFWQPNWWGWTGHFSGGGTGAASFNSCPGVNGTVAADAGLWYPGRPDDGGACPISEQCTVLLDNEWNTKRKCWKKGDYGRDCKKWKTGWITRREALDDKSCGTGRYLVPPSTKEKTKKNDKDGGKLDARVTYSHRRNVCLCEKTPPATYDPAALELSSPGLAAGSVAQACDDMVSKHLKYDKPHTRPTGWVVSLIVFLCMCCCCYCFALMNNINDGCCELWWRAGPVRPPPDDEGLTFTTAAAEKCVMPLVMALVCLLCFVPYTLFFLCALMKDICCHNVDEEMEMTRPREPRMDLWQACSQGDVAAARLLLNKGVKVDRANKDHGTTPLYVACDGGHVDAVLLLLSSGADFNRAAKNGATPLGIAQKKGHSSIVALLEEHIYPLHAAAETDEVDGMTHLIDGGAVVDQTKEDGVTPLWVACRNGHVDAARLLLEKGAEVDRATENGQTPLFVACAEGHVDAARLLLNKGAEVDRANQNGATPLYIACQEGHVDAAKLLLDKDAAVDRAAENGATPLGIAQKKGHSSIVALLEKSLPLPLAPPRLGQRQQSEDKCSICLGPYKERAWTNCNHSFCRECITKVCRTNPPTNRAPCPFCRQSVLLGELTSRPSVHEASMARRTRYRAAIAQRPEAVEREIAESSAQGESSETERRIAPPPAPARAASDTTSDLEIARALSREDDAALAASLQAEEAAAASLPRPPP